MPEDFLLSEKLKQYAIEHNIQEVKLDELFQAFKDYHIGHGTVMIDWDRAWYTFVRNAPQFSLWAIEKEEVLESWQKGLREIEKTEREEI